MFTCTKRATYCTTVLVISYPSIDLQWKFDYGTSYFIGVAKKKKLHKNGYTYPIEPIMYPIQPRLFYKLWEKL